MGISVLALQWFTSYLTNRNISIMIDKYYSPDKYLKKNVCILSISIHIYIYIHHIADPIKTFPNRHYYIFADDIQMFTFSPYILIIPLTLN